MFSTSLKKYFIAQHRFERGSGYEREMHSHYFAAEVTLFGEKLGDNGYLVDLDETERVMESIIVELRDRSLNDISDLGSKPPSVENIALLFWKRLIERLDVSCLTAVNVRIWENESASASYEQKVSR